MVWRPFYFAKLIVDPNNPDKVFKTDGMLIMSEDGGKSFANVGGFQGAHGDVHAVWIDPTNSQTVITGDDGGMYYSYNGGSKWWKGENLPISQFYHVSVDDADPYRVYGGLQDNGSWMSRSQYPGGIPNSQWETVYGGDGFWVFADPADPDYLYAEYQGGNIGRVNRHTLQGRDIQPKPNYKEKLRWNWNTPIALSPTEKGTIYIGSQFLFRSRNQGQTWDRISPDLTTNDPQKQQQEKSGGITVDNSAAEMHTTIYSISESPKDKKVIWVGTDDGNVQVTRDAGKTWTNVVGNIAGLPKNSWVSWVQASNFEAGHRLRDLRSPYVWRSHRLRLQDGRFRQDLDATRDPAGAVGCAGLRARDQGRHRQAEPAVPRNGVRALHFDRWRKSVGAIQRQPLSRGRGARHRDSTARQRARSRDPRSRHLDRGRHHAAARVNAGASWRRKLLLSPRGRCNSASRETAGAPSARPLSSATIRPTPRSSLTINGHAISSGN